MFALSTMNFSFDSNKKYSIYLVGLLFAILGQTPLLIFLDQGTNFKSTILAPLIVWIIIAVSLFIIHKKFNTLTEKGVDINNHLLGLKEFIKQVKKDEVEKRLKEDPLYLDKILPYALLFDQNEHWLSFYKLLQIPKPDWYMGDMNNINYFSLSVIAGSKPIYSNSSIFSSGGGFSGGGGSSGGGGGGGGSW